MVGKASPHTWKGGPSCASTAIWGNYLEATWETETLGNTERRFFVCEHCHLRGAMRAVAVG